MREKGKGGQCLSLIYDSKPLGRHELQREDVFLDARRKRCADGVERGVETVCQGLHAGNRTKRDESHEQSIFHQILTILAAFQILEHDTELEK